MIGERLRHASPQAWRRLQGHIYGGEARDLAKDLAAWTGGDENALLRALTCGDFEAMGSATGSDPAATADGSTLLADIMAEARWTCGTVRYYDAGNDPVSPGWVTRIYDADGEWHEEAT